MPFAARKSDTVTGSDVHLVQATPQSPPVPTPLPFNGKIDSGVSRDVFINGKAAAVAGSGTRNSPAHQVPPPAKLVRNPSNAGKVARGSMTVLINGKAAARSGDPVTTCNDPSDAPTCKVVAFGDVEIGG